MQFRGLIFASGVCLAILASYYAGYRHGLERRSPAAIVVPRSEGGESDRAIPRRSTGGVTHDVRSAYSDLTGHDFGMPLEGIKRSAIIDTFDQSRGSGRRHEATDIMAPRGTPIHAVEDGQIRKLFFSKAGGNTIYEFDPESIYCFYYAHLDRYAGGLHEGMNVKKGDVIGYVGSTGDASTEAPHLHFTIFKLGPEKNWWQGTAINPYPILVQLAGR